MRVIRTRIVHKPIGLGDIVASVLHTLGFTQHPDCGCADRQSRLNQMLVLLPKNKDQG